MIDIETSEFWRATLALCIGSFMVCANVYVTHPLLPMFSDVFAISPLQASWSLTVTTLTLGLSLLIFGPMSDALGRRRLMIFSMAGVVICSACLSQVSSFSGLLALRAVQGFFLAGLPAIAIAYMGDEFTKKGLVAAVGFYISGNTLGGIGGRLIGGFSGDLFGWQDTFLVMTVVSVFCLGLFIWLLPPSVYFQPKRVSPKQMVIDGYGHLSNPMLLLAYVVGGLNFFIFINQYSYATFLLSEAPYHLPTALLGMLFLTYLSGTFGAMLSGKISSLMPQPIVMSLGIVCMISGTLLSLYETLASIIAAFLINAFGFFVAHSSASSWVSHTATYARATASSLYLVFYYVGASVGGLYLNPFWKALGWQGIVLGSIIILMVTLCCALLLYYRSRQALVGQPAQG